TYYSDEFGILDKRGKILPYPRPIRLKRADGKPGKTLTAADLGGAVGDKPLPLGLVVDTRYRQGCRWRPRPVSMGRGLLSLLGHALPVLGRPAWTMSMLGEALEVSDHLRGTRGEADEAAERILHEFADW